MYLKMLAQRLTLLSALLGFVSAGISVGHCPHVSAVHVGETNFAGRWYEIRRVKPEDEGGETCNFEEYNFRKDVNGWSLRINSTGYTGEEWRSSIVDARQYIYARHSAQGYFVLGNQKAGLPRSEKPNFFVLHADENFSLAYFCQGFGSLKMDLAWIMSRERFPDPEEVNEVQKMLRHNGVFLEMTDVDQEDCPATEGMGMKNLMMQFLRYSQGDADWRY